MAARPGTTRPNKQAPHRLERSLRSVLEAASEAILVADAEGIIVYINRPCASPFAYRPTELVGRCMDLLVPARLRERHRELRLRYARHPYVRPMGAGLSLVGLRRDGTEFPVEVALGPAPSDGELLIAAAIRDLSEQVRAEAALRRSEAAYRDLVAHAPYGIYRSTPAGRFLAVNPALVRMLRYESAAALLEADLTRDIYVDPSERERLMAQQHGDVVPEAEVRWRRKDGTPVTVVLAGRLIRDPRGESASYEMFAQDVTDERALELQLRQAQKMEALGQLTAGIAHDFNNLLTVVLANAEVVADRVPAEDTATQADLRDIAAAARRGSDMIRKLMAFTRRGRLEFGHVDPTQVVRDIVGVLRRVLPENVRSSVVTAPSGQVLADRGAVEQILMNLATNARDAMREGGRLTVEVTPITVDEAFHARYPFAAAGTYARIAVSDTGTGIDAQTRAHVFEPFFTTKPLGEGTGLGLAMVYGLVKQHQGFVILDSELGKGTCVAVYLPVASDGPSGVEAPALATRTHSGKERILLVEDDEAIRRTAQRVLSLHGYTVTTAADGADALRILGDPSSGYDLIITDAVMPIMGGEEMYRRARAAGVACRFLLTSGYSQATTAALAADARLPFLRKPWTTTELIEQVRQVLDAD